MLSGADGAIEITRRMHLNDWIKKRNVDYPAHSQQRLTATIRSFIRTKPTSVTQAKLFEKGKLYPWLRDTCGLIEIQTVGDLAIVFQKAKSRIATEEPWIWFHRTTNPSYQRSLDLAEAALKNEGLL